MAVQISVVAFLVFLPFIVVSVYSDAYMREVSAARAHRSVLRDARHVSQILEKSLDQAIGLMSFLSRLPQLEGMDGRGALPFLLSAKKQIPGFDSLSLVDPKGNIVALVPRPVDSVHATDWSSLAPALASCAPALGGCQYSPVTGRSVLSLSVPVMSPRGRVAGVIVAGYSLRAIRRILDPIDLPAGTAVEVIDPNGLVLVRTEGAEGALGAGPAETTRSFHIVDSRAGMMITTDFTGRRYCVGSAPLYIAERPSAWVLVHVPYRVIYGPEERLILIDTILMAALGLLAVLGAMLFARIAILRKVAILKSTAEAYARGDFQARTGLDPSCSELGEIARTIDGMAESIVAQRRFADNLLENIDEGVIVCGPDGRIEFANPIIAEWQGRELSRLTAEEWASLVGGSEGGKPLEPEKSPLVRACRGERIRNDEIAIPSSESPSPRYLICSGGPLLGERGEREGALLLLRDISELRQATNELVATNAQLVQAQKMEAIGRLAGGIAHDFNNVLTVISGFSHMILADGSLKPTVRSYATEVKKAATRAAELTSKMLVFSRAQVVEPRIVDLSQILSSLEKMLGRLVGEDMRVEMLLAEDLWKVKVDPTQVEQVMMNLASNARDAMPQGGRFAIETANVQLRGKELEMGACDPGDYVRLTVSDTGIGMSKETLARVFDPFFTTKPPGKGTGLGLSTVYGIVRQLRGQIGVSSELGKGTTFRIYLPRAPEEKVISASVVSEPQASGGSERLLVVEDNADVRGFLKAVLEGVGYRVSISASAEEALSILKGPEDRISLVITDVVMPGMSGIELAQEIGRTRPKLPVLVISGYARNVVLERGEIAPGVLFLGKPLTAEKLLPTIRKVLDNGTKGA